MKLMDSDGDLFTVDERILWSYTVQFLGIGKLGSRLERPHWIPPHHWARVLSFWYACMPLDQSCRTRAELGPERLGPGPGSKFEAVPGSSTFCNFRMLRFTSIFILVKVTQKYYRSNVVHYNSETVILYGNELLLNNSNKSFIMYYSLEVTCTTLCESHYSRRATSGANRTEGHGSESWQIFTVAQWCTAQLNLHNTTKSPLHNLIVLQLVFIVLW